MDKMLAQINLFPPGGFTGPGTLGKPGDQAPTLFNQTISKIIGVMTVVAFIWFTFQFMIGAIRIVTSGGDKGALEGARKQLTTGIIGLVVVIAGIFIVELIGDFLGIQSILKGAGFIGNGL